MTLPTSPAPKSLRFGLIGCGDIGRLRAEALKRGGVALSAVADVDAERANAVAKDSGSQVVGSWRELITRNDVDAVVVSTPPRLHHDMCVAAAEAGKHVLCEKPLALDSAEGRAIVAAADRCGVRIATGFNYRFYPSFALAKRWLADGRIGTLDHIRSYGGYSAQSHNQPWVHDVATAGGGALRDIGIHLLDLTCDFMGPVSEVVGMTTESVWKYGGCEDNGFALLRGQNGVVASVQASWTEWRKYRFSVELYGSHGFIQATCFPMMAEIRWASEVSGPQKKETNRFLGSLVNEKVHSYRRIVVDSFVAEHAAFGSYVAGAPSRIATACDGTRSLEIVEQATRAAAAGRPQGAV